MFVARKGKSSKKNGQFEQIMNTKAPVWPHPNHSGASSGVAHRLCLGEARRCCLAKGLNVDTRRATLATA